MSHGPRAKLRWPDHDRPRHAFVTGGRPFLWWRITGDRVFEEGEKFDNSVKKKEEEERRDKWKRILVDCVTRLCLKPSLKSFYFEFRFE